MPELTPADLDLYTKGRLPVDDVETNRILQRALRAARRYCEWHVTPVKMGDVVTLDGPGHRLLMLPTMKLITLNSVMEDGAALDVSKLKVSAGGPVRVRKDGWCRWSHEYSSIIVNMDHGYTEDEADDWRLAVLDACDR